METSIVVRDSEGKVINIGAWDTVDEVLIDPDTHEETIIQHNPLPDGATSKEEEIITLPDGGLAAAVE